MRVGTALLIALVIVAQLAPAGGAEPDPAGGLVGHWRCTAADGSTRARSYFAFAVRDRNVASGDRSLIREIFGRADWTLPDRSPITTFERIAQTRDGPMEVESPDGHGTAMLSPEHITFSGRSADDVSAMTLNYAIDSGSMHRTARNGNTTVDDERCTRIPDPPATSPCAEPNVHASVVTAVEPNYPAEAVRGRLSGSVAVRVVLDDRSRVLWANVVRSANPVFNDEAVRAARESSYRTALANCRPIAGEYVFVVSFTA